MLMRVATIVQVLQDLFYCMFYFRPTCDRSLTAPVLTKHKSLLVDGLIIRLHPHAHTANMRRRSIGTQIDGHLCSTLTVRYA